MLVNIKNSCKSWFKDVSFYQLNIDVLTFYKVLASFALTIVFSFHYATCIILKNERSWPHFANLRYGMYIRI